MPLEDVLARIPGKAGYLAQQQYDDRRNQSALGQLLGVVGMVEQQKQRALQQQMQQAQLAEFQRKAMAEQAAEKRLQGLGQQFQSLQQPTQVVASENDSIETPGLSADAAMRQLVPQMIFDPNAAIANRGASLAGKLEATDARQEMAKAQRDARMQELQMRLADARITAQERMELQRDLQSERLAARQDMIRLAASMRQPREDKILEVVDPTNPSRVIGIPQSEYLRRRSQGEDLALRGGGLNPNQVAVIEDRASRYVENNPVVKQFTQLEPEVKTVQNYMARRANVSNADRAVYDKNLVNTFMRMTHPKGDQISNFERKDLAGLPDLPDRVKVAITSVFQGKHLPDDIAASMNNVIQEKYGAMYNTVSNIETQAVNTVTRQGGSPDAVRKITRSTAPKKISSEAEYNALKSGEQYIDPNGTTRTKK